MMPPALPAQIRNFDQFRNAVSQNFCPMSCETREAAPFSGQINLARLNSLSLARIGSAPIDVHRTRAHISQIADAYYLVKFQLEGKALVRQRQREAYLEPGDFVVCTTTEPYDLHFPGPYRQAVLSMPRKVLGDLIRSPDTYLGQRMAGDVPANGLLSQFVGSLSECMNNINPALAQRLEANVLDLLVTALEFNGCKESGTSVAERGSQHLYRIRNFINLHLADPDLCPATIAKEEGISVRYLHMLFSEQGTTVSRHIQQQRLDACKRSLERQDMNHLGVADIAYRWGFNDGSHFSRLFKSSYDVAPREYRLLSQRRTVITE